MKHKIISLLFILIVCLLYVGCETQIEISDSVTDQSMIEQSNSDSNVSESIIQDVLPEQKTFTFDSADELKTQIEISDSVTDQSMIEQNNSDSNVSESIIQDVLPEQNTFTFDSADELKTHFINEGNRLHANVGAVLRNAEYDALVKRISSGKADIIQPFMNGKALELRNKDGYSNITLFTSELYGRPWIWYHCIYDSENYTVKVMYLTETEISDIKNHTASSFIASLSSDAPNVNNTENFSSYERIYEGDIQINKTTTKALYYQLKNGKTTTSFIYGGALIMISGDGQKLFCDFSDGFDIA